MKKIAIYGKGGIGKSTIAANLSAAFSANGHRVLQIGCDPKHDSTRLLLGGRQVVTVLEYMRDTAPANQRLNDLLHTGFGGVVCTEAGGPEPGVGCAGRGILSTFALFERLGLKMEEFDVVLYDVLGDVVCGGFAVPLRKGFADSVIVVTSEEFMAVYAANNILRGIKNFDDDGFRLAGILLNSRGPEEDQLPVERFASAAKTPIIGRIPRSDRFRQAEKIHQTIVEAFPDAPETDLFYQLSRRLTAEPDLYPARPLEDRELERIVLGEGPVEPFVRETKTFKPLDEKTLSIETRGTDDPINTTTGLLSKSMLFREPLHGCAFTGAVSTTNQVRGAVTIAHGPRSCSHIAMRTILSSGIRTQKRSGRLLLRQLSPSLVSSDMNESSVIYGGSENLRLTLRQVLSKRPEAVFVVATCPAGVIGDDPQAAIREAIDAFPEIPVLPITADGNIQGDYMQGILNACTEGAASLIDPETTPQGACVNILAEKNIANNAEPNFEVVVRLLQTLGIEVHCRFIRDTSVEKIRTFLKAPLNLLAYEDHFGRVLRSFFSDRYAASFASFPFPVGFTETERWLVDIANHFGKVDLAKKIADGSRDRYKQQIRQLRRQLAGRRMVIVSYIHDVDWILEIAFDTGMKVEKVGILDYSQDHLFRTRFEGLIDVEIGYTAEKRDEDLKRIRPDLLLCNYVPGKLPIAVHVDGIPLCPDVGFGGAVAFANRWASLLKAPIREGWRDDATAM
jgi:nitrogenase iron protein NifH